MQGSHAVHYPRYGMGLRLTRNLAFGLSHSFLAFTLCGAAMAQSGPLVLERPGRVISLEPYAPNILRVTMSIDTSNGDGGSGIRICGPALSAGMDARARRRRLRSIPVRQNGRARGAGRSSQRQAAAADAARPAKSGVAPPIFWRWRREWAERRRPWPTPDALLVTTADGRMLLHMRTWTMRPESPEVAAKDAGTKGYLVAVHLRLARR